MKHSYVELYFRHRWVVVPLVVVPAMALALVLGQPRQYESTLSIWSDSPATSVSTLEGGAPAETPSATQQSLLEELLTTPRFLLTVAQHTPLAASVDSQPRQKMQQALLRLGGTVTTSTPGPQLLTVTATGSSPAMAQDVASAVGSQLVEQEVTTLTDRDAATLNYELQQMDDIFAQMANSAQSGSSGASAVAALQAAGTNSANPLVQEYLADQQQYDQAEADKGTLANSSVLSIFDPASPAQRVGRKKMLILAGAGGLLAGATMTTALLLVFMATDDTVWGPSDLTRGLGLKVVSTIDRLSRRESRALAGVSA